MKWHVFLSLFFRSHEVHEKNAGVFLQLGRFRPILQRYCVLLNCNGTFALGILQDTHRTLLNPRLVRHFLLRTPRHPELKKLVYVNLSIPSALWDWNIYLHLP